MSMICRDIAMDFLRSIKPLFLVLFTNRIQKLRETRSQLEKEVKQVIREFGDDNRTSRCDTLEAKPGIKEDEFIDKSIKNKSTVPDGGLLQQSWAKRSRSKEDLWDNADEDEGYSRRYLISLKMKNEYR